MTVTTSSNIKDTKMVKVSATIGGTGAQTVNVFQFTGTIAIVDQYAEITRVGTLTNLTNMYASIYDGTNAVNLTADGAVLSGAPVYSFFTISLPTSFTSVITFSFLFKFSHNRACW